MTDSLASVADNLATWGLKQWDYHLRTNLEEIRSLRSSQAIAAAEAFDLFKPEEKKLLAAALVGRFSVPAQRRPLTDVSIANLLQRFDTERGNRAQSLATASALAKKPLLTRRLKSRLKELLPQVVGTLSSHEPGSWLATLMLNGWTVTTAIAFGGRARQLVYEHIIQPPTTSVQPVRTSILTWLGLSSTIWDMVATEDDAEATCLALTRACETFFKGLPELLPKT